MQLLYWLNFLKRNLIGQKTSRVRNNRKRLRSDSYPCVEVLEDRTLLSSVSIQQLSAGLDPAFSISSVMDAAGDTIVFESDADLTDNNGDGSFEIFLFEQGVGLTQITDSASSSFSPSISPDGNFVAFASFADHVPDSNTDGNGEIFLLEIGVGFTQITDTTTGNAGIPEVNHNGTRIPFIMDADLTGGNSDGGDEIFLYDAATGFTQVTDTNSFLPFTRPRISGDGSRIVFSSDEDLLGDGSNTDGSDEVFLFEIGSGLTQITSDPTATSFLADINVDGNRIVFDSDGNFTGENSDGSTEIFTFDIGGGFVQITDTVASGFNISPIISGDGTAIAFQSFDDLTGENSESIGEVFLFREGEGLTQITNEDATFESSFATSINADGTRIGYESEGNP
ncbi:MAG: PD40 domain-containing protein, partial [Planctomycetes bacterium]|nr:PD40 domain-containing protein [Planctomycetota bacterium]